ncbi:MAG: SDR family NAD(P)-dependent oxidoreductase [Myxococcota bacterium]|nr:SDR family NAD(P)-dependent oxidoreductase [Myxococcota bacterium]
MHVVITGASSGIGAAIARELGQAPEARVSLVARRRAPMERLAAELGIPTHVISRDLSDLTEADRTLDEAEAAHGPIDVLVNNAGVQVLGATHRIDLDEADASVRLNLLAPLRMTARVLRGMRARGEGTVVQVASMAAIAPTPGMTWYNASKAGLAASSEALRSELRGTGVHVMTVYPGIIAETDMAQTALARFPQTLAVRMQPTGTAAELARLVRRGIERRHARVVYPRVYAPARWFIPLVGMVVDRWSPRLGDAA